MDLKYNLNQEEKSAILLLGKGSYSKGIRILLNSYLSKDKLKKDRMDYLKQFIETNIEITNDPTHTISLKELYGAYKDLQDRTQLLLTKQQFRKTMEEANIWYGKLGGNVSSFRGIRIIEDEEWL